MDDKFKTQMETCPEQVLYVAINSLGGNAVAYKP